MATVTCFEDLDIWKKAQDLGVMIYRLCDTNLKIAEGFEYSNNNDFWRFLRIAKGSCGEVRSCIHFSVRVNYSTDDEVYELIEFARTLAKQIGNLMNYLKRIKSEQSKTNKTRNP